MLPEYAALKSHANSIRKNIIHSIHNAQTGHPGSSLSIVELLTIIYFKYLKYDVHQPKSKDRDYFILSKGHSAPALYAVLCEAGFINEDELLTLRKLGSRLQGHPNAEYMPRVDVTTGSLGQGLSIATGLGLGFKMQNMINRIYIILGDGELQEGQIWEAAMAAANFKLSNITAFVDRNHLQNDGNTEIIMPLNDLADKWRAFGWYVFTVNGHDFQEIDIAIQQSIKQHEKPTIIIANTIKGKGISFMEGIVHWHHHPINETDYNIAMKELECSRLLEEEV